MRPVSALTMGIVAFAIGACGLDVTGASPPPAEKKVDGTPAPPAADGKSAGQGGTGDPGNASVNPPPPATGGSEAPKIVAFASTTTPTATLPSETKAGDLLAVLVAQNKDSPSSAVTSITDDADDGSDTFVSANQRSTNSSCGISTEIWYAKNVKAGAKKITVNVSSSDWYDVWVVELSGLASLDKGGVASSQPSSNRPSAPQVTPTASPAIVLSVAQSCSAVNGISGLHAGSPFTALSSLEGNGAAYLLTSSAGAFGAVFDSGSGAWNASTAAFR